MEGCRQSSILVVDDDKGIRETVADFLEMEGYHVLQAASVDEARGQLELKPDLVLLDIKMPGGDGLTFTGEIRRQSSIPIIIISAKGDTVDRIVGLEVGADDYLPKPFELRELLSRIRALLRRSGVSGTAQRDGAVPGEVNTRERAACFGGCLLLLPGRRQVVNQQGAVIDLTPQEFNLLAALVERPKRVHGREAIAGLLRSSNGVGDRNIDALVSRLRHKLNDHVDAQALIQTVRGEGYVLASEVHWTEARG